MKALVAPRFRVQIAASTLVLVVAAALAGCVTRGYKLAPKDAPAATALNLPAAQPSVDATLQTVIVYKGPGSWKREAYWDEYVLTIANRGAVPLTITSAALHPTEGEPVAPTLGSWKNPARNGGRAMRPARAAPISRSARAPPSAVVRPWRPPTAE